MTRRDFLKQGVTTAALCLGTPLSRAGERRLHSLDQLILAGAQQRIEQGRTGRGAIIVIGRDGKPVPGARVRLEQVRHEFLFGANFFLFNRLDDPELEQAYRKRFAALLNSATLGFYWGSYERERGHPNYDHTDAAAAWCAEHRITCKGHPLVWDARETMPQWLSEEDDVPSLSLGRVREIVARYKGRIDMWDVVNEPSHAGRIQSPMGKWAGEIGTTRYVAAHLKAAREANPAATLLVNDYRTDNTFLNILEQLEENGRFLFDAVGIQSHMHAGTWPLHSVWSICDRFARLGRPIHFTETTVLSGPAEELDQWEPTTPEGETAQADYVASLYTTLFSHPAVERITWWDLSDLGAWKGAPAGWLRRDMTPKPVYDRLLSLIKDQWWTRAAGQTDLWGEFRTRAFFGAHRVTVTLPNGVSAAREVNWRRGATNRFVVRLTN